MELSIAIDFSTKNLSIAIMKDNSKDDIKISRKEMTGREASSMLPWIIEEIDNMGFKISDIKKWSCGIGPGSFTGLRIIASLIAGLTFSRNDMVVRGVPSANAIANKIGSTKDNIAILYDGRRNEIIYFAPIDNKNQKKSYKTEIISGKNLNPLVGLNKFDTLCAMDSERTALEKIIPTKLFDKIKFLNEYPIEELLLDKTIPWLNNNSKDKLFEQEIIYIRPAV